MPKAQVMRMQDCTKLEEITADEDGRFIFEDLAPGRYRVQIKQPMNTLTAYLGFYGFVGIRTWHL